MMDWDLVSLCGILECLVGRLFRWAELGSFFLSFPFPSGTWGHIYLIFLSLQFLGGSGVLSHGADSPWSFSPFWIFFYISLFLLDRRYILALGTLIVHGL